MLQTQTRQQLTDVVADLRQRVAMLAQLIGLQQRQISFLLSKQPPEETPPPAEPSPIIAP